MAEPWDARTNSCGTPSGWRPMKPNQSLRVAIGRINGRIWRARHFAQPAHGRAAGGRAAPGVARPGASHGAVRDGAGTTAADRFRPNPCVGRQPERSRLPVRGDAGPFAPGLRPGVPQRAPPGLGIVLHVSGLSGRRPPTKFPSGITCTCIIAKDKRSTGCSKRQVTSDAMVCSRYRCRAERAHW